MSGAPEAGEDGEFADLRAEEGNALLRLFREYGRDQFGTFAFGGVAITPDAEVLDTTDRTIPGLFAAGNSTGGLFYENYPGGTGLTNAAVFGRVAAESAAEYVGVDAAERHPVD